MTEWRLEYRGTLFPVRGGELTLGRSSYASIVVNNPLASRDHAVVRLLGNRLEVLDLGSRNGTFVNGARITAARRLEIGDRIKLGTELIEVVHATAEDPSVLRMATLPGQTSVRPGAVEEDTIEVAKLP